MEDIHSKEEHAEMMKKDLRKEHFKFGTDQSEGRTSNQADIPFQPTSIRFGGNRRNTDKSNINYQQN